MTKKKITLESVAKSIDDLAVITAKGFDQVYKDVAGVSTVLKADIAGVRKELTEVSAEVSEINDRLKKYYHPTLESQAHRIKVLETHTGIHKDK